ncbi:unnamed protein product [Rhizophagus irregularis]|nr:unnamed protein product [Rhizophagus irregularis]
MSTQDISAKPTYREIESALIAVIKAGILYKKPKDAQSILPNETKYQQILENYKTWYSREPKLLSAINKLYRLYYELAKDYFLTDSQADDEVEDYLNS